MSKQLLIETRMNSLSLCEGVQSKHPGCLGTLRGPCADFIDPTRNSNFYSRRLWENVFNDDLVKEALQDRVLIGELDHPGDRLETKAANACIVMTDYSFNDETGTVDGTFDILDTPMGKILRSLLDYGCKIGVSSRGEGDVTEGKNGINNVDEDGYYFVAFDAVVLPAVKKAKPALQESLKRKSLKESLESQINGASTKSELDLIRKVLEATEMPDIDSLLESINNKSKELEGVNDSSNLMEDLENATARINALTEENKGLKKEVTDCNSRIKRFIESRVKASESESSLTEDVETLTEEYKVKVFEVGSMSNEIESLKSKLTEAKSTIRGLRESLRTTGSMNSKLEARVSSLEESLERSQSASREKTKIIAKLREDLDLTQKNLSESKSKEAAARSSASQAKKSLEESVQRGQNVLENYATKRAQSFGINPRHIVEHIKSGMTTSDIDNLIEEEVNRNDRFRKVPIVRDPLIETIVQKGTVHISSGKSKPLTEEDSQTVAFMEQYYNQN